VADSEIVFQPASKLGQLIKTRKLSPVEVVRAYLDRIDAVDPKVGAFITVTREQALRKAEEATKEIGAGHYRGPLHGLPYAPKDLLATKGVRTTNGSKITADWIPSYESTITARLNDAGAILVGKLHSVEFAIGSHWSAPFGLARNPWHLDYSPSGSSSGPGAAVGARMTPLAIGTDTGGSIRKPAHSCGIVGLKPTYGRVSRFGVTTLSWTLDHAGPMTTTVADNALLLQAISGADALDGSAAAEPVPDFTKALTGEIKGLRIGVPTKYFFDGIEDETAATVRTALAKLTEMGAVLVDVNIANAELIGPASAVIRLSEAASFHEKRLREHAELFEPLVRQNLEVASFYSALDYIRAVRMRSVFIDEVRRVFERCDVMAAPVANPAPKLQPETARSEAATKSPASSPADTFNLGNMTGIPAIVVPCGFTAGPPSLPVGIQFYSKAFDEATLFRVADAYQSVTEWHKRRPPITA
jgi:aspartyl-tRNA(Asn)/glutamyl-tRNA(Gln) amidotransferase subunit A